MQLAVANRGRRLPAGTSRDDIRPEALAAPRPENDVRGTANDLAGIFQNAVFAERAERSLGEHIIAAGNADQLAHPPDARDEGLVPLLEIHPRAAGPQSGGLTHPFDVPLQFERVALSLGSGADHGAQAAHVTEDSLDSTMIADPDLDPLFDQCVCDLGLDIGEADDEIRPQLENAIDLGAGEG